MLLDADTFDKAVWNFKIALCKRKKQKTEFSIDISNTCELGVQFSNIIKVISNFYIIFYSTGNLNISPNAHIVLKIDDFNLITLITFVNYSWLKKLFYLFIGSRQARFYLIQSSQFRIVISAYPCLKSLYHVNHVLKTQRLMGNEGTAPQTIVSNSQKDKT